tara:strand:- start:266 stop:640 length:375 start_codon:yes stop_codon:yes gene_type:complete
MKKVKNVVEVVVEVVAIKGRPVNENSARQLRLKELEAKKAAGTLKKGRPVDMSSERQVRLAKQALNKANGIGQGRPVDPNSVRQQRLAELEAKKAANGGTIKRGRPAQVKAEVIIDDVVELVRG